MQYEAATPPFRAEIKSVVLSEDAKEPGVQCVIATVDLTHAIEPGALERQAEFKMLGASEVFAPDDPAPHFTVVYGLHSRQAFLRSSPVVLPKSEDWMRVTIAKSLRTAQGGAETPEAIEQKTLIPGQDTAFQIKSVDSSIVRTKTGEPEQILNIETTGDINTAASGAHILLKAESA